MSNYSDTGLSPETQYCYTVTAVDTSSNESSESAQDCATTESTGQSPYGGTAWAIPGTIEAEDYDEGGEGVAYHDTDSGNNGGAYRSEDVDIQSCSDTGGGYNVGWIDADEWLEYTVDVSSAGSYDIEVRVASQSAGGNLHIEFGGVDKTGTLSFGATGGWQTWTSVYANGVSLDAGQQVMRIYMESASFNVNKVIITESGAGGSTTLTPTADALDWDPSWGCDGDYTFFGQWDYAYIRFDLSTVGTPVSSATLGLQYISAPALTIYVWEASSDSWDECNGPYPSRGTQLDSASASGPGWYEFDVTSYVASEASGDGEVTFCVTQDHNDWQQLASRISSNPPELTVNW